MHLFRQFVLFATIVTMFAQPSAASQVESAIQSRFAAFQAENDKIAESILLDQVADGERSLYDRDFASLQHPQIVSNLSLADVALLFQAANSTQFYTADENQAQDMQLDLRELAAHGKATQLDYVDLERAFFHARDFASAREVLYAHPGSAEEALHAGPNKIIDMPIAMSPIPTFVDESHDGRLGPTEIVVSADGRKMIRRDADVNSTGHVIVIITPDCEFAQGGMKAIEADAKLNKIFSSHATWLILQQDGSTVDEVRQWNAAHPSVQMVFAYRDSEWPMVDRRNTPTFFFLENGAKVDEVSGYLPPAPQQVNVDLKRIGLL